MSRKKSKWPMRLLNGWLVSVLLACPAWALAADSSVDWPTRNLAAFVFEHLDLASFRNSTGPLRRQNQRLFIDLGIKPTRTSETEAVFESSSWTYSIKVLGRRDFNKDETQEVAICFADAARQGTYNVQQPLLLQMLEGRAVAIAFDISADPDAAQCQHWR